jgi:hypothetical protein
MANTMAMHQSQNRNDIFKSQAQTSRDMQTSLDRSQKAYNDFMTAQNQNLAHQISLSSSETSHLLSNNQLNTERALNSSQMQTFDEVDRKFNHHSQLMSGMMSANGERNLNAMISSQYQASKDIRYNTDKAEKSLIEAMSLQNKNTMGHVDLAGEKNAHNMAMHQLQSQKTLYDSQNQAVDKLYDGMDRQTQSISGFMIYFHLKKMKFKIF